MSAKKLSFREWIDKTGVAKVAQLLGVNPSSVRHWRTGHCVPQTEQMQKIKRLSKGTVTYEAMIERAGK